MTSWTRLAVALTLVALPALAAGQTTIIIEDSMMSPIIRAYQAGVRIRMEQQAFEQMQADRALSREFYRQQMREMEHRNQMLQWQEDQLTQQRKAAAAINVQAKVESEAIMAQLTVLHADWPKYEQAMLKYSELMPPGKLGELDYLEALYFLVKRDERNTEMKQAAEAQAQETLAAFSLVKPDWKTYEPRMLQIMKVVPPTQGATDIAYLSLLYELAARERRPQ